MESIMINKLHIKSIFGYYVGSDFSNYINFCSNFEEIKRKLDDLNIIKSRLDVIDHNIKSLNKS
jgi:hypothetical protein